MQKVNLLGMDPRPGRGYTQPVIMQVNAASPRLNPFSAPPGAPAPSVPQAPAEPVDGYAGPTTGTKADDAPEPKASTNWTRKLMGTTLAGLALVGVAGGVAGSVLINAPICPGQTSPVSISREGICVSPDAATDAATAWRQLRGTPYTGQVIQDLASQQSRALQPGGDYHPPAASRDGGFRTVSWNLHHSQSPNQDGSRDQLDRMIQELRDQKAEVILLQEVNPWHAQDLVDGTGMVGYYSQTTSTQGNMILVHPDLEVLDNAKVVLNHDIKGRADAAGASTQRGGREPRQAQALRLALPSGKTVLVWNTHLSTGDATDADRAAENERLLSFVETQARPGEAVLGGGDLNNSRHAPAPKLLDAHGFDVQGATIDWLAGRNLDRLETGHATLTETSGIRVSDHPMVWAEAR